MQPPQVTHLLAIQMDGVSMAVLAWALTCRGARWKLWKWAPPAIATSTAAGTACRIGMSASPTSLWTAEGTKPLSRAAPLFRVYPQRATRKAEPPGEVELHKKVGKGGDQGGSGRNQVQRLHQARPFAMIHRPAACAGGFDYLGEAQRMVR